MLHDETKYPNPEKFDPERFLRDGVLCTDAGDPRDFVFGFGRRCERYTGGLKYD